MMCELNSVTVQFITVKLLNIFHNIKCAKGFWVLHFADGPLFRLVSQPPALRPIYIIKLVLKNIWL